MVGIERPEFVPDPSLDRAAMEELQRSIAAEARWTDDLAFDPAELVARRPFAPDREPAADADDAPVIAAVDQAFREDSAVSAAVATRDGEVVERVHATAPLEIPYIPGLLAFREGGSILAALDELAVEPDVLLVDGSGRIHYREAGLATHVGVTCDVPAVGVAKSLLCGTPTAPIDDLAVGDVVPIEADAEVTAEDGTTIGAAVQTRQFDSGRINPLYVSPGHRVSWETAAELVLATTGRYKLPEPVRMADREVGELAAEG